MGPGRWAAAGAVVALLAALALFDFRLFLGGDNAYYMALAKALAEGRGYVDLVAPGHPPHTQYPPGFPLLLVPAWWLGGGRLVPLKLVSWIAAGVALSGLWALARRDRAVPPWAAAGAVWLLGLYPAFLAYAHWVLSEMAFVAISVWALWAMTPLGDDDRWTGRWLAGCLLALFGFLVRTAGLTLFAAAAATALVGRQWRRAAAAAGVALLGAVPWLLWSARNPPPTGGYLEQFLASDPYDPTSPPLGLGGLAARAWHTVGGYATTEFPRLFWPAASLPSAARIFGLLFGATLLALGVGRALRARGIQVWDLHALLSAAMLSVWPWSGDRFFLTIAPFVWLYLLIGLDHAARGVFRLPRAAPVAAGAVALVLLVGGLGAAPGVWEVNRRQLDGDEWAGYPPYWRDTFEAARWIGDHAPDAVIVARKPTFAWYWSRGRPAFVYPFRSEPEEVWRAIRARGASHVLLDRGGSTAYYLVPALQLHFREIEVIHAAPERNALVVRLAPEGERAPGPAPEAP